MLVSQNLFNLEHKLSWVRHVAQLVECMQPMVQFPAPQKHGGTRL